MYRSLPRARTREYDLSRQPFELRVSVPLSEKRLQQHETSSSGPTSAVPLIETVRPVCHDRMRSWTPSHHDGGPPVPIFSRHVRNHSKSARRPKRASGSIDSPGRGRREARRIASRASSALITFIIWRRLTPMLRGRRCRTAPAFVDEGASQSRECRRRTPWVQWQSNVKHQRARATASRVNGTISLRALRCMR